MESSRILFIFSVIATIMHSGVAIKCYNCISDADPMCLDPKNHMELTECTPEVLNDGAKTFNKIAEKLDSVFSIDIFKSSEKPTIIPNMVCQKLQLQMMDKQMNSTVRSCQIGDGNLNICEKLKSKLNSQTVKMLHCSTCNTDGCNSGPHSASLVAIPTIISFIILSLYLA